MGKQYDRDYFERWYRDPALRREAIGGRARLERKVALAVATAEYWLERPIRSVLDIAQLLNGNSWIAIELGNPLPASRNGRTSLF